MTSNVNVFTVSQASKPSYHRHRCRASFRPDMKRQVHFLAAAEDASDRIAAANWAVYLETWDTQPSHVRYLRCLLSAAFRYQTDRGAELFVAVAASATYRRFRRKMMRLWYKVHEKMARGTADQYVECLNEICSHHLFDDLWVQDRPLLLKASLLEEMSICSSDGLSCSDEASPRAESEDGELV